MPVAANNPVTTTAAVLRSLTGVEESSLRNALFIFLKKVIVTDLNCE